DRLSESVANEKIRSLTCVSKICLKRIVIRIGDRLLRGDRTEIWSERSARSVKHLPGFAGEHAIFSEGAACWASRRYLAFIAQAQAEGGIPRIRFLHDHVVMSLI